MTLNLGGEVGLFHQGHWARDGGGSSYEFVQLGGHTLRIHQETASVWILHVEEGDPPKPKWVLVEDPKPLTA